MIAECAVHMRKPSPTRATLVSCKISRINANIEQLQGLSRRFPNRVRVVGMGWAQQTKEMKQQRPSVGLCMYV